MTGGHASVLLTLRVGLYTALACGVLGCPCERSISNVYYLGRSTGERSLGGVVSWEEPNQIMGGGGSVFVSFTHDGVEEPEDDMLELYPLDGSRYPLESRMFWINDNPLDAACEYAELRYLLTDVPNGEYTLVHRFSSAPAGYEYGGGGTPEIFDGEPALVTTLILDRD